MDKNLAVLIALKANKSLPKTHPFLFKRGLSHIQFYDRRLAAVMERHGLVNPWTTLHAVRHTGAFLSVCCALLQMESQGGLNIFGCEPTGEHGALNPLWYSSEVTKVKYLAYLGKLEHGYLVNKVGPCQLADPSLQRGADYRGGCWNPLHNMTEGFSYLRRLIDSSGSLWQGFYNYNGSGNSAVTYADKAMGLQRLWHERFMQVR